MSNNRGGFSLSMAKHVSDRGELPLQEAKVVKDKTIKCNQERSSPMSVILSHAKKLIPWSHSKTLSVIGHNLNDKKVFIDKISITWKSSVMSSFPGKVLLHFRCCSGSFDSSILFSISFRAGISNKVLISTRLPLPNDLGMNPYSFEYQPDSASTVELGELDLCVHAMVTGVDWSGSRTTMSLKTSLKDDNNLGIIYVLRPNDGEIISNIPDIINKAKVLAESIPYVMIDLLGINYPLSGGVSMVGVLNKDDLNHLAVINKKLEGSTDLTEEDNDMMTALREKIRNTYIGVYFGDSVEALNLGSMVE